MSERPPTVAGRWREALEAGSERRFLTFESRTGETLDWTYAEFDALIGRVAGGLAGAGVTAGGRVHVVLANSPAFVATWLACARLGATIVPSDPRATTRELRVHAERSRPQLVVVSEGRADQYPVEAGADVLAVDEDDGDLGSLTGPPPSVTAPVPSWETPAGILFTSGTTSAPKGVVVTQANYAFAET